MAMLEGGWQQEVLDLVQKGLSDWLLSMRFIGYAEVLQSLSQPLERSELAQAIADSTWRLVKKQRTWSRSESSVEWFSAESDRLWEELWERLSHPTET
jgi:tRNA A37 N6-isopentenylltransferase MiaA